MNKVTDELSKSILFTVFMLARPAESIQHRFQYQSTANSTTNDDTTTRMLAFKKFGHSREKEEEETDEK